jgi:hypothetical protein
VSNELVRRGSARADVPLSRFAGQKGIAEHILPAFEYAATVIPSEHHSSTRVLFQATAGMRLLSEAEQADIYDTLYEELILSDRFVFSLERDDIATLSGDLEGFFGAVAANYLKGTINADLELVSDDHGPIGALDMGGSSTQIVFLPSDRGTCNVKVNRSCHQASLEELPSRLNGNDFFATSYLSYGVDQFRERLWNTWVNERKQQLQPGQCDSKIIENPCTFRHYEIEWDGYTLVGTGDAYKCVEEVRRLIPHPHEPDSENLGTHVGGVEHPPVRGKFFAMSLFFFALDSLRELSAYEALNLSWPTPTIHELYNALDGLCSRAWHGDLEDIKHEAHAFTRPEVLPHRCLETVYMVTLLRDGFGFDPHARDITFTFLVDDSEVEWTLGLALAIRAEQRLEKASNTTLPDTKGAPTPSFGSFEPSLHHGFSESLLERMAERLYPYYMTHAS